VGNGGLAAADGRWPDEHGQRQGTAGWGSEDLVRGGREGGREASTRTRAQRACGGHPPAHLCDPGGSAATHGVARRPHRHGNSLVDVDMDEEKASVGLDWDR